MSLVVVDLLDSSEEEEEDVMEVILPPPPAPAINDSVVVLDSDDESSATLSLPGDDNNEMEDEEDILSFGWRGKSQSGAISVPLPAAPPPRAISTTTTSAQPLTKREINAQAKAKRLQELANAKVDVAIRAGKYRNLEVSLHCSSKFQTNSVFPILNYLFVENERTANLHGSTEEEEGDLQTVWFRRHFLFHDNGQVKAQEGASQMERLLIVILPGTQLCEALADDGGDELCSAMLKCKRGNTQQSMLVMVMDCNAALAKKPRRVTRAQVDSFLAIDLGVERDIGHVHLRTDKDVADMIWNHFQVIEDLPYKRTSENAEYLDLVSKSRSFARVDSATRNTVDASRLRDTWSNQLQSIKGLSMSKADCIVEKFPSCAMLFDSFRSDTTETALRLQNMGNGRREIKLARLLTSVFTSTNAEEPI